MTTWKVSDTARKREALLAGLSKVRSATELFAMVSTRLRRYVPFEAAVWRATDPTTGVMTAPVRVENLDREGCIAYWSSEPLRENVNRWYDLVHSPCAAAALRASAGEEASRSALYRSYLEPRGFDDELRAVLRTGERPWGAVSLFRRRGHERFGPRELGFVASLSNPIGERLRALSISAALSAPERAPVLPPGPGLLLFDADGELVSANESAKALLAELPSDTSSRTDLGLDLPAWLHGAALWARQRDGGTWARVRARSGRWLVCHASCLRGAGGAFGPTAVVLEPAKISELALLIGEAHGLSARELEVAHAIVGGLRTREIAEQLLISTHTVRDHIKAILRKVGARSRGELVATLFQTESLSGG
ncbi:LuxR C-terminal-related transcriptional regulator [Pendulispora albinea]|uniref:Helix-turn-helix transcriptional regulator n=1 Tax=Pendulispora albinea TaxID=2741071 RepID=A0ABZ2M4I5_9BACT